MITRKEKKLVWAYRNVFVEHPQGNDVLTDILNDLGFFKQNLKTPEDIALHNAATKLLGKLGVWRPHNLFDITRRFTDLPAFSADEKEELVY